MENEAPLSSLEARMMADYASGRRGDDPRYLVGTPVPGGYQIKEEPTDPGPDPTRIVVPIRTVFVRPDRPKVDWIQMHAHGSDVEDLMEFDAVFWSEASVEKFLFPYLASKYQWRAAEVLEALSRVWYGDVPHAMDESEEEAGLPFAIGHLPRSEYVTIPGQEVHILFRHTDNRVTRRPLSDFLQSPKGEQAVEEGVALGEHAKGRPHGKHLGEDAPRGG